MSSLSIPVPTRLAPLVPGLPIVGNLFNVWRDPLDHLMHVSTYGEVARVRFGPMTAFLLNDPDAIHHVLVDNNRNYTKSPNYAGLKLLLGEGLVTSEGEFWRRQRKLAQPAFQRDRVNAFAGAMIAETDRMLDSWEPKVGEVIDLHAEMMKVTLRIAARTLFGTAIESEDEAEEVGRALTFGVRFANEYVESLVKMPAWLPTPKNRTFKKAVATLDALVYRIIDQRRAGGAQGHDDLLSLLMAAVEDGRGMTNLQLRDEVMTLVMAGHETTANALAWTFYLLSKDPEVERRLRRDVTGALGDSAPGADDVPRIKYAKQVIEESMRLYPPAWIFERQAIADDVVAGYTVPKRSIVAISPWVLHRQRALWDNPEGFDPDRFAADRGADRPRFAYLPFGAGPRQCIGMGFAMLESQLMLARIVQRFRLELVPSQKVVPEPVVTLRPLHGLRMRVRKQPAIAAGSSRDVTAHAASGTMTAAAAAGCPMHQANGKRTAVG